METNDPFYPFRPPSTSAVWIHYAEAMGWQNGRAPRLIHGWPFHLKPSPSPIRSHQLMTLSLHNFVGARSPGRTYSSSIFLARTSFDPASKQKKKKKCPRLWHRCQQPLTKAHRADFESFTPPLSCGLKLPFSFRSRTPPPIGHRCGCGVTSMLPSFFKNSRHIPNRNPCLAQPLHH